MRAYQAKPIGGKSFLPPLPTPGVIARLISTSLQPPRPETGCEVMLRDTLTPHGPSNFSPPLPSPFLRSLRPSVRGEWHSMQWPMVTRRSEEHTSELQSLAYLVCRLLLEKKKKTLL